MLAITLFVTTLLGRASRCSKKLHLTPADVRIVPGSAEPVGAPHGGGTCQFALSYDNGKTFTVIHSIEGGCPLDAVMNKYTIKIPDNAPSAERARFAWTWFNRIGNR